MKIKNYSVLIGLLTSLSTSAYPVIKLTKSCGGFFGYQYTSKELVEFKEVPRGLGWVIECSGRGYSSCPNSGNSSALNDDVNDNHADGYDLAVGNDLIQMAESNITNGNTNGQSVQSENGISRTYKCGAKNSSKFKIAADGDFIFYFQDERQSKTNLYKINTLTGFIDSFSFTPNNNTDLSFYELTAMDVSNDTLVICYGNNIYIYSLTQENKCLYCKNITISSGDVVFSASLFQGNLYVTCDRPNETQKHSFRIINCNSGEEVSRLNYFTHLATLTTFKPSHYFASRNDTVFYYDSENFQILTIYKSKIDTFLSVKDYFESNSNNFIKSTAKIKGFKELDHYIMNLFGKFPFDFIHEIYIANSKIYLYFFPANHGSFAKLERQLCVIDRGSLNKTDYVITRTTEHSLLDFQSVLVGDELYMVSNNDNSLYIKEYSKLIKK